MSCFSLILNVDGKFMEPLFVFVICLNIQHFQMARNKLARKLNKSKIQSTANNEVILIILIRQILNFADYQWQNYEKGKTASEKRGIPK